MRPQACRGRRALRLERKEEIWHAEAAEHRGRLVQKRREMPAAPRLRRGEARHLARLPLRQKEREERNERAVRPPQKEAGRAAVKIDLI